MDGVGLLEQSRRRQRRRRGHLDSIDRGAVLKRLVGPNVVVELRRVGVVLVLERTSSAQGLLGQIRKTFFAAADPQLIRS